VPRTKNTNAAESRTARRRAAAKVDATDKYLARRGEIVQAATDLFREKGVAGVSIDDIARAAGVDRSAVYYYFGNKEELFREIVIDSLIDVMELADHIDESPEPPEQKLELLIRRLMTSYAHRYPQMSVYLREDVQTLPELNLPKLQVRFEQAVTSIIREGVDEGIFRSDIQPRVASYAIQGMLAWTHRWFDPDGLLSADDVAKQFATFAIAGLRKT
jgi:TetR/AcrR family transcriptional regulator, cholesterol catabolism regulator